MNWNRWNRCQTSTCKLRAKLVRFGCEVYKLTSGTAVLVFALCSAAAGPASSTPANDVFVSVELDVSDHPGDLRDAAASLERETGFAADARFPPRFTGANEERVELWGWLPSSKLGRAVTGAVRRVEIERPPKNSAFDSVPSPNRIPSGGQLAPARDRTPPPGYFREHLGQALLTAFLTVMGFVILRSPKRIARITRRFFPKK